MLGAKLQANKTNSLLVLWAIVVTLFISTLDEGYYDFRWMKQPGNWIAFGVYGVLIFFSIRFFYRRIFSSMSPTLNMTLSVFVGSITCLASIIAFFYGVLYLKG